MYTCPIMCAMVEGVRPATAVSACTEQGAAVQTDITVVAHSPSHAIRTDAIALPVGGHAARISSPTPLPRAQTSRIATWR